MTVTPKSSESGIRETSGGSAVKANLDIPTGTGPTSNESRSWSSSDELDDPTYVSLNSMSEIQSIDHMRQLTALVGTDGFLIANARLTWPVQLSVHYLFEVVQDTQK